jgi:hypothetical protein
MAFREYGNDDGVGLADLVRGALRRRGDVIASGGATRPTAPMERQFAANLRAEPTKLSRIREQGTGYCSSRGTRSLLTASYSEAEFIFGEKN